MTTTTTLRRTTTITKQEDWDKRVTGLLARLEPYLQKQPGFVSHELARDGDGGGMMQKTTWQTADDCTRYIREGAAAMAATWIDGFLPTAPYPNGNWVRETTS
jgi:heme-degrading monooxygenase HmoA